MDVMQGLTAFITANLGAIILCLMVGLLLALMVFISINVKFAKINKRYRRLMTGAEGMNLEQLLMKHIEEVRGAMTKIDTVEQECREIRADSRTNLKKFGIVRFNAFEDTGSDLSFAIAVLDEKNDGLILSSIYGRNESRVYAKPIQDGQSSYFLSDEEKAALAQAQEK